MCCPPAPCTLHQAYVEDEAVNGNAVEEQQGHDASILLRTGPGIWSKEVRMCGRSAGGLCIA
jgi:hypothetical protein